jgi:monoamine oxidase
MQLDQCDVVVVGGGISGLAAARHLVGVGLKEVVVVDARPEPGGRCLARSTAGHLLDCGGAWTSATQDHIKNLASAYGIGTYSTKVEEQKLARLVDGVVEYFDPDDTARERAGNDELDRAIAELDRLCASVPADRAWAAKDAGELDLLTVEGWINSQTSDPAVRTVLAEILWSVPVHRQVSMLSLLTLLNSCGGRKAFESELDELFVVRTGRIAHCVADDLGERLRLGWPVRQISWSSEGVRVAGPEGVLAARRAIVAMSPTDAGRIQFQPGLSTKREMLHRGWLMVSSIKMNLIYARPFWREPAPDRPALAGGASDAGGPHMVVDSTPADSDVGVLTAFSRLSGEADRLMVPHDILDDPDARLRRVLDTVVQMFGLDAGRPLAVQETHWHQEPYVAGCFGFAPPGLLTQCGEALREPVGPIHWAGTEAADVWINHLSGAVQSGERAATEVAAAIRD